MKLMAHLAQGETAQDDGDFHWVALSDLMSSLMMIFLFLSILHMVQVERTHAIETEVRTTAAESRHAIFRALENEFRGDLSRWNAELVERTLTLRFREPDVLFDRSSARIKPEFEAVLRDFLPRYVAQLRPFKAIIREIRIEGHTSSEWSANSSPLDAYFANMQLSQERTQAVLRFAYGLTELKQDDWFGTRVAAVGLSSSRPVLNAGGREDLARSRRVEFSVLTDFEARLLEPISIKGQTPSESRAAERPEAASSTTGLGEARH